MAGWGNTDPEALNINITSESVNIKGTWKDAFEAIGWREKIEEKSKEPLCHIMCGVLSGFYSAAIGREILVRENHCHAQGYSECAFEARTIQDWNLEETNIQDLFSIEKIDR